MGLPLGRETLKGPGPVCSPTCPVPASSVGPSHCPLPQALRVNSLEQLCNNLASERLRLFSSRTLQAQEEVGRWPWLWWGPLGIAQHSLAQ